MSAAWNAEIPAAVEVCFDAEYKPIPYQASELYFLLASLVAVPQLFCKMLGAMGWIWVLVLWLNRAYPVVTLFWRNS